VQLGARARLAQPVAAASPQPHDAGRRGAGGGLLHHLLRDGRGHHQQHVPPPDRGYRPGPGARGWLPRHPGPVALLDPGCLGCAARDRATGAGRRGRGRAGRARVVDPRRAVPGGGRARQRLAALDPHALPPDEHARGELRAGRRHRAHRARPCAGPGTVGGYRRRGGLLRAGNRGLRGRVAHRRGPAGHAGPRPGGPYGAHLPGHRPTDRRPRRRVALRDPPARHPSPRGRCAERPGGRRAPPGAAAAQRRDVAAALPRAAPTAPRLRTHDGCGHPRCWW